VLEPWVSKARKTGGGRRKTRRDGAGKADLKAVRAWAAANNVELSKRGRIPQSVLEQYHKANQSPSTLAFSLSYVRLVCSGIGN
jgi:hypothetical protein